MKENNSNRNLPAKQTAKEVCEKLTGYPVSPEGDDIYNKYQEEKDIDPEDISKMKELNDVKNTNPNTEMNYSDVELGNDLDVPGSELDDRQENIGSEDEENNYYSLANDDLNDPDEDRREYLAEST